MNIQWYPGHMTKTRRQIQADLKLVDLVVEVIDARIPLSSRNPDIDALVGEKPRLIILNRADQADPEISRAWSAYFKERGCTAVTVDSKTGKGVHQLAAAARQTLRSQIDAWREKGQVGRPVRAMVVGVPNVGKSTLINKVAGRKSAKAGDRPGVTRGKQWVNVDHGLDLLDTPGILWPKFEDEATGLHLAFTGAVKDEVMDGEGLACALAELLNRRYPGALEERYHITAQPEDPGYVLLEKCARKRGFLIAGGKADTERMASILLDEYRGGKLGRFTLELPSESAPRGESVHG